ncbi:phage portal protein [Mammaliicoccus lentus]|uniref:Phage portal protein n=1 Tax=Mammaliicoccus lentus TaxID=42858 RepID=A0AAX3W2F2_MAMLE|nr:phage portal protein [Mammaliicoccus lentus]WHI59005.1 phage portal protein [Mammaliicoccus lentus]
MGIFYETRQRYSDNSDMQEALGVYPFQTVPLSTLDWHDFKALRNSDIWTAVTLLSRDIAKLDIKVRENGIYKDKDQLEMLLNKRPNNVYNGYMLKYVVMMNALLTNHGYIKIERNPNGGIYELYFLQTSRVTLQYDQYRNEHYYEVMNEGNIMRVPFDDIIDIKPFSTDGINGLSVLDALEDDLNAQTYSKKFFTNFFTNGAQAGSVLKMKDGKLSREARNRLKEEFQKENSGQNQAGKVLVMDSTMEYEQLEISTDILEAINKNTSSTKSIAKAFQIPLSKFGMEMTNTSMKDVNNDYLMNCLGGYMKTWEAELNFKLIPKKNSYSKEFKFDTSEFKKIDWDAFKESLRADLEKGVITHDEYRMAIGLEPYPDGMGAIPRYDLNHISADVADDYQLRQISTNNSAPKPDKGGGLDEK